MSSFPLDEEDLQMEVKGATDARKFDDASHGLSHCMKAVDFIVERPDRYLFIEFKDPQNPASAAQRQGNFQQNFLRGKAGPRPAIQVPGLLSLRMGRGKGRQAHRLPCPDRPEWPDGSAPADKNRRSETQTACTEIHL